MLTPVMWRLFLPGALLAAIACGTPSPTRICGNGAVEAGETCDGDCPVACPPPSASCVVAVLVGGSATCDARCEDRPVTTPIADDFCCPEGASKAEDRDCPAECGNGIVEEGEACEPATTTGCPLDAAACDDGVACTRDTPSGEGCLAVCRHEVIGGSAAGVPDGCCPAGASPGADADCSASCGNGTVEPHETCDTAIAAPGAGACPALAACEDGDACTIDLLVSAETCAASCAHDAVTDYVDGDGCCPPGGQAPIDSDCEYW